MTLDAAAPAQPEPGGRHQRPGGRAGHLRRSGEHVVELLGGARLPEDDGSMRQVGALRHRRPGQVTTARRRRCNGHSCPGGIPAVRGPEHLGAGLAGGRPLAAAARGAAAPERPASGPGLRPVVVRRLDARPGGHPGRRRPQPPAGPAPAVERGARGRRSGRVGQPGGGRQRGGGPGTGHRRRATGKSPTSTTSPSCSTAPPTTTGSAWPGCWRCSTATPTRTSTPTPSRTSAARPDGWSRTTEAVQILTIWTAKGLEFPIVCVPTLWRTPRSTASRPFRSSTRTRTPTAAPTTWPPRRSGRPRRPPTGGPGCRGTRPSARTCGCSTWP